MRFRQQGIERQRLIGLVENLLFGNGLRIPADQARVTIGDAGEGTSELRVEVGRADEHVAAEAQEVLGRVVEELAALQIEIIGLDAGRGGLANGVDLGRHQPHLQLFDDGPGDLVLDGENVGQIAIIAFGPDMAAAAAVDQLAGDPQAVAGLADAAFEQIADAKIGGDPLEVLRLALVGEAGVAADHKQAGDLGQIGDDVLGDAFGEIIVLWVAAQIVERQHRDRRLFLGTVADRRAGLRRRRFEDHVIDADRPVDVLELLVAAVGEDEVELVADMLAHRLRDGDAARPGNAFQPRRDIDAVAENVVALDDDIAKVDADAKLDAAVVGDIGVAARHAALDGGGAFDRVHDAWELNQYAVAGQFDDPALAATDFGLDQLGLVPLQALQGADLIGAHQPAVADDVGGEDGA